MNSPSFIPAYEIWTPDLIREHFVAKHAFLLTIPGTLEFGRFLHKKIAALFVESRMLSGRQNPGYACQPTRKTYPPLRVPSPSVRTIPGKLEFRSVMVPHRSYVGTIDPVKKIDETTFVTLDIHHFLLHILPGTGPYGSANPTRPR